MSVTKSHVVYFLSCGDDEVSGPHTTKELMELLHDIVGDGNDVDDLRVYTSDAKFQTVGLQVSLK